MRISFLMVNFSKLRLEEGFCECSGPEESSGEAVVVFRRPKEGLSPSAIVVLALRCIPDRAGSVALVSYKVGDNALEVRRSVDTVFESESSSV